MDTTLTKSEKTPNEKNAVTGRLFLLDLGGGRVLSVNPDGSDLKTIVVEGRKFPTASSSMSQQAHLYWTNMGTSRLNDGSIVRSDLDGRNVRPLFPRAAPSRQSSSISKRKPASSTGAIAKACA